MDLWKKIQKIEIVYGFGEKSYIDYNIDYNIGYTIRISIYGFPGIPGGIHGYLGGTDGTLGPMGPWDRWDLGLKDPRYFLGGYFLRVVYRYPAQPSPAQLPGPVPSGPGAGSRAARPVFIPRKIFNRICFCFLPGVRRAIFRNYPQKKFRKMAGPAAGIQHWARPGRTGKFV